MEPIKSSGMRNEAIVGAKDEICSQCMYVLSLPLIEIRGRGMPTALDCTLQ